MSNRAINSNAKIGVFFWFRAGTIRDPTVSGEVMMGNDGDGCSAAYYWNCRSTPIRIGFRKAVNGRRLQKLFRSPNTREYADSKRNVACEKLPGLHPEHNVPL